MNMEKWNSIENRLPDTGQQVLVTDGNNIGVGRYIRTIYCARFNVEEDADRWELDRMIEGMSIAAPTHWMYPIKLVEILGLRPLHSRN